MRALPVLLVLALAPRANADCDVSTDAGIDAAYQKATGNALPHEHRCVRRAQTFPDVVTIGHFAYDRGCRWSEVLVGCKLSPSGYAAAAMAKAGWTKADAAKKQSLALAWLREVDDRALIEGNDGMIASAKITALVATPARDGTLRLEGWVREPPGMRRGTAFTKIRVTFAADGSHDKIDVIDNEFVPG